MTSVFLDTTDHVVLGLWQGSRDWSDYLELVERKSSSIIHHQIYEFLQKNQLKLSDVNSFIIMSGPGSYTGIRLSYGLAEVLQFAGKEFYSLYHFEIPRILGQKQGAWVHSAFKGEMFVYEWENESEEHRLLTFSEFREEFSRDKQKIVYLHSPTNWKEEYAFLDRQQVQFTSELMKKHAQEILTMVLKQKSKKRPFYYRPLEREFNCTSSIERFEQKIKGAGGDNF